MQIFAESAISFYLHGAHREVRVLTLCVCVGHDMQNNILIVAPVCGYWKCQCDVS